MSTPTLERTVTKRQLNQETATVLASVAVDQPVVVTERGRPEWRISRYGEAPLTGLARLEALGQITPINPHPAEFPTESKGRKYTSEEIDALLAEMDGDH